MDRKITTTQQLSWHQAKSPYSRPYEEQVLLQLVNSTIEDVSVKESLGYDAIEGIVEQNARTKVNWEQFGKLNVSGIFKKNTPPGTRTLNPRIKSPLLCQLS